MDFHRFVVAIELDHGKVRRFLGILDHIEMKIACFVVQEALCARRQSFPELNLLARLDRDMGDERAHTSPPLSASRHMEVGVYGFDKSQTNSNNLQRHANILMRSTVVSVQRRTRA
jgi:hypothetical protein